MHEKSTKQQLPGVYLSHQDNFYSVINYNDMS